MTKNNYIQKGLSVLLAMLMIVSVFSFTVSAEAITLSFADGVANIATYNTAETITGFTQKENTSVKGGTASGLSLVASSEGTVGSATWNINVPQGDAGRYLIQLRYKNELTDTSKGSSVKASIIEESVTVNDQTDTDLEVMSGTNSDSDIIGIFDFSEGINTLTVRLKVKDWIAGDSITPAVLFTNIVLTKKDMPELNKTETIKISSHDCTSYRGREEDVWASNSSHANCYDMEGSGDGAHIILGTKGNYASYTFNVTESYTYDLNLNLRFWDASTINVYVDGVKERSFAEDAGKRKILDAGTYFLEKGIHTIKIEQATNNKVLFYYYLEMSMAESANLLDSENGTDLNLVSDMITVKTTDKANTNRFSHGEIVDTSLPYITVNSNGNAVNPQYVLFAVDTPEAGYYDVSLIGGSSNAYMDFEATVMNGNISKDYLLRYVSATEAERTVGGSVINPFFFSHRDTMGKIYLDEGVNFIKLTATYGDAYLLNVGLERSKQQLDVVAETKLLAGAISYITDENGSPVLVTGDAVELSANKTFYYEVYSPVALTYKLKTYAVGEEVSATITKVETNETVHNGVITQVSDSEPMEFEVGNIMLNQGYTTLEIDVSENTAMLHYLGFVPQIDPSSIVEHVVPAYEEKIISAEGYTLYSGSDEDADFIKINNVAQAVYNIDVKRAGNYDILLSSAQKRDINATLTMDSKVLTWELSSTNDIAEESECQTIVLTEGKHSFVISADNDMNLYSVKFKRTGTNDSTKITESDGRLFVEDFSHTTGMVSADGKNVVLYGEDYVEYKLDVVNSGVYTISLDCNSIVGEPAITAEINGISSGNVETSEGIIKIENVEIASGAATIRLTNGGTDSEVKLVDIDVNYESALPVVLDNEELTVQAEDFSNLGELTKITDGSETVINLNGKTAEYIFKTPATKTYRVIAAVKAENSGKLTVSWDGKILATKAIPKTLGIYDEIVLGYINVFAGEIKQFELSGSGDALYNYIKFEPAQTSELSSKPVSIFKENPDGKSMTDDKYTSHSNATANGFAGYIGLHATHNDSLSFDISVPSTGIYKPVVYIGVDNVSLTLTEDNKELATVSATDSSNNYWKSNAYSFGEIELTQGAHTIELAVKKGNLHYYAIEFIKVGGEFDVDAVAIDDKFITNDTVISSGVDYLTAYFTLEPQVGTLTAERITLVSEDGNDIPLDIVCIGTAAELRFKESLVAGKTYILTFNGVCADKGAAPVSKSYTFDTILGSCAGSVVLDEYKTKYNGVHEQVYLKYVVKSSKGVGISGRPIKVTRTAPAGDIIVPALPIELISGVSGENGIFEVVSTIPEGGTPGSYIYAAETEFGSHSKSIPYVSMTEEKRIFDLLEGTTADGADDTLSISSFFETFSADLGIAPVPESLDEDRVYDYFAGNDINTIEEFVEKYEMVVYAEIINQADDDADGKAAIKSVLQDEQALDYFAISEDKVKLLLEKNEAGIVNALITPEAIRELDKFTAHLNDIVENEFMLLCDKEDILLKGKTMSIQNGQSIAIPLEFDKAATDVIKAVIVISSDNTTFKHSPVTINAPQNVSYTKSWNGNTLTIEYSYGLKETVTNLGSVVLSPENSSTSYTILAEGNLIYDVNLDKNEDFDVEEDIPVIGRITQGTFSINVSAGQGGSGSGGGGAPSRPAPSVKPDNGDKESSNDSVLIPQKPQASFKFKDIDDAVWAKEYIEFLLEKGIVSESEDGKFNPDNNIKRSEFLKLVMEALGLVEENAKTTFTDVSGDAWYCKYVASAEKLGIVLGNSNGEFSPDAYISRQDMSVIIVRALKFKNVTFNTSDYVTFADDGAVAEYAKSAIYELKTKGIINGVGDNRFDPLGNATRAQTAKMVCEMIKVVQ